MKLSVKSTRPLLSVMPCQRSFMGDPAGVADEAAETGTEAADATAGAAGADAAPAGWGVVMDLGGAPASRLAMLVRLSCPSGLMMTRPKKSLSAMRPRLALTCPLAQARSVPSSERGRQLTKSALLTRCCRRRSLRPTRPW